MNSSKTLAFVPTYNERENVEKICSDILALGLDLDILFVDDNSPDGTGKVLDEMAQARPNVTVLHRSGKLGIGSAHIDAIRWAYEHKYVTLITMDCDFTHPPSYIPDFIAHSKERAVVVGSRYMRKDSLSGWNAYRWTLTHLGHALTRYFLDMPYDATGAYRLYRLDKIPARIFSLVHSSSYSFFFESLYLLHLNKVSIEEIPINLPKRTYGTSKMAMRDIWISVMRLVYLYSAQKFDRERFLISEQEPAPIVSATKESAPEWDAYWLKRNHVGGSVYDIVATFYRKKIIKKNLERYIWKYFKPGAKILHAGCGSGQVDSDISKKMHVTALDISLPALEVYKNVNQGRGTLVHGSLFKIPLENESLDGIYNLGVMEHFTAQEIQQILMEFHRVLKNDGTIVLFWPPEFGLSVWVFKILHLILNTLFKRNIKLHPDEISRIKSKNQVRRLLEEARFRLVEYYFGPRDGFIQVVVVASKIPKVL